MSAVRKNYTEREKCLLLSLVDLYKDVVENKCTNAVTTEMKSKTWDSIACRFNASSEYPRTSKQLHTLYLNMKRITRQNIAAENINKYTEQKKLEELKQLKKDAAADKKGINATGGGSYQPLLTDAGAQMLAIIEEQVKPLTNDCDSASEYYRITAPVGGYNKPTILFIFLVIQKLYCDQVCDHRPLGTKTEPLPPDSRFQIEILNISDKYIPSKTYTVRLSSTDGVSTFIAFTISVRGDTRRNERNPRRPILLNPGQIRSIPDSDAIGNPNCNNTVIQKDITAKTVVEVEWRAPPKDNKCVTIFAVIAVKPDVWYSFDGPLSKLICEDRRNMEDMQPTENDNCQVCEDAQYLLTFEGIWSCHTHPLMFPEKELAAMARFSDVVGASHNKNYNVFKTYSDASQALKMLAEQGNTTKLEMEMISLVGSSIRTVIKASGQAQPNMVTHSIFRVSREHHLVSLVTAIIPSPDWFLGVANMELCTVDVNRWAPNLTLNLYPLDAGTDSGMSFSAPNEDTMPPQPIKPAIINKSVSKEEMKPFAKLHFELVRTYTTLDCETTESVVQTNEYDRDTNPSETPQTTTLTSSSSEEYSVDPGTPEECPMTAWEEWEPCAGECANNVYRGYRTRSRYYLVDDVPVGKDLNGPNLEVPEMCFDKYSDHETEACEEECEDEETVIRYSNF